MWRRMIVTSAILGWGLATTVTAETDALMKRFNAFIDAYNQGTEAAFQQFFSEALSAEATQRVPIDRRIERQVDLRKRTGPLKCAETSQPEPNVVECLASGSDQRWFRMSVTFDQTSEAHFQRNTVTPAAAPAGAAAASTTTAAATTSDTSVTAPAASHPAPRSDEEIASALRTAFEELKQAGSFSGSVAVARNDKIIFETGVGYANQERKIPNRPDLSYNMASMTKMLTGTAIMQLIEQKKLQLDDTIAKVLPDYPNKDVAQRVTVRQLLTHTSGLPDYFNDRFASSRTQLNRLTDYLPLFANDPLVFEPGARWKYTNANFVVLGLMIEKTTGLEFQDYFQKNLFKPAHMKHSGCFKHRELPDYAAIGYTRQVSRRGEDGGPAPNAASGDSRPNTDMYPLRGSPAGACYASPEDLIRFSQALQNGVLLRKETLEAATSAQAKTPMGESRSYGFGFGSSNENGVRSFGHNGGGPGTNTDFKVYPATGITVVVMSNQDPPGAEAAFKAVKNVL